MPPRTKKPTLETHSFPCCGECYYSHVVPEDKAQIGCYATQPGYLYGQVDEAEWADFIPIKSTRPACKDFKLRNGAN